MVIEESNDKQVLQVRQIAITTAFTALVFLSTSIFSIGLVSSTGFFNLGEAFVFLAAIVGGPIVGGIAGGLGSALADAFLGYGYFAPGTLILKGLEGIAVGFFFQFLKGGKEGQRRGILALVSTFLLSFAIYFTTPVINGYPNSDLIEGSFYLGGDYISFTIPGWILVLIAILLIAVIWFVELQLGYKGEMVISCALASPIIVIGYFLYEVVILEIAFESALFEVPFNIAQVVFGILIVVPIVSYLDELGVLPTKETTTEH